MEIENGSVKSIELASSSPSKRRKMDSQLLNSPENSAFVSSAVSVNSSQTKATSSSSNGVLNYRYQSLDPNAKAEGFETDLSTFIVKAFSKETSKLFCRNSEDQMESSKKKTLTAPLNSRRRTSAATTPSAAEIEEFFSVAEKYELKRFAKKYNYDIVKDVPLEGRYDWVKLNP